MLLCRRASGIFEHPPAVAAGERREATTKRLRIATVYRDDQYDQYPTVNMAMIRWLRISQALSRLGARVDMIVNLQERHPPPGNGVRFVPFDGVRWGDYDVVKAFYQRGFDTLARHGGADHPFIVGSLATIVGSRDGVPGVQVLPADRAPLWDSQVRMARACRWLSVRTVPNQALFEREFPDLESPLLVPTGVDRIIPETRSNPYRGIDNPVALYSGNLRRGKPNHLNQLWADRLNRLGEALRRRHIQLCFVGPTGSVKLDPGVITNFGPVVNEAVWDFKRHADVGLALAEGPVQLNESSKLYYYLRAGLPVVSEAPIPNNTLLANAGAGWICEYDDPQGMAERVEAAVHHDWPMDEAAAWVAERHSWENRAGSYAARLGLSAAEYTEPHGH